MPDTSTNEKNQNMRPTIITIGNEKGGVGKTTLALHLAIYLLRQGHQIGTLDLAIKQPTLTHFFVNRTQNTRIPNLIQPEHFLLSPNNSNDIEEQQKYYNDVFLRAIEKMRDSCNYIIMDCASGDTYFSRLAHSISDIIITPTNESFVDLDSLFDIDQKDMSIKMPRSYVDMVVAKRDFRRKNNGDIKWLLARNRTGHIHARNRQNFDIVQGEMQKKFEIASLPFLSERTIYRELFLEGLTVFDIFDEDDHTASHEAACAEIAEIVSALDLPQFKR